MAKKETPQEIVEFFAKFGREGGKKRAGKLTAKRRRAIAQKAAQARWNKKEE